MARSVHKKANGASLNDFFINRFGWQPHQTVEFTDFMTKMMKILDLSKDEVRESFEALDISKTDKVNVQEIIYTLKSYMKTAQEVDLDMLNIGDIIPGYAEMTP